MCGTTLNWQSKHDCEAMISAGVFIMPARPIVVKTMFSFGRTYEEYTEVDGAKHGLYKRYFPNGVLDIQCQYKEGQMFGKFKCFHPNGKMYKKGTYF